MSKNGLLIAIEGIDGSGKSSLAKGLHQSLKKQNLDVILTQESGGTSLGQKLRNLLHYEKKHICDKAEYLLFATDRAQHFEELIIPSLSKGKIIISDRMADSSLAYQGYGRQLDVDMIKQINKWAMNNIEPDLIFYIKIDFRIALPRVTKRGETLTSFEKEEELFWERVSEGFETIFKNRTNVATLDGEKSIEELTEQATKHVLQWLQK